MGCSTYILRFYITFFNFGGKRSLSKTGFKSNFVDKYLMKWFQLTEYACCTFVSIHLKVLTYISISSLFRLFASQYSGHLLLIFPHIYFSKPYALNQIHPKGFNWAPKKALKKPNMPKLADVLRGSAIGRAHGRENTISRGLVPWPWVQAVLDRA